MNIKEKSGGILDKAIWRNIAKGLGISLIYWLAYLAAWFNSLDQWFLPAGVRAVGLLFLPYRYWPYLFAADAAALLALRIPTAWQYGKIWAYLSPFLLAPMVALVPIAFRHKLQRIDEKPIWLPAIVASIAIWSSFCKNFINSILSGPSEPDLLEILLRYVAGDFLGILTIVLPIMVWLQVKNDNFFQNNLIRDSIFSILLTFSAYFFVFPSNIEEFQNRVLLLMCVVVLPSLGLTIKYGWIGSAIGITAVNLSVFLGFPGFNFSGAYDSISFLVQQIVIVYAIAALSLGAVISQLFDRSRKIGISEVHALKLARSSFLSTERSLRGKFLFIAQMQFGFDEYRKKLVSRLKEQGHHAAAMELNSEGVQQMEWFERHAVALYPIQVEKDGLFAALHADAFTRFWADGADVMYFLKGHPKKLSLDLQLAAYRCLCNSFALLYEYAPDCYEIRARTWHYRERRGVTFRVKISSTLSFEPSDASTLAAIELEERVRAFGGAVKRRTKHQISFFLPESNQ